MKHGTTEYRVLHHWIERDKLFDPVLDKQLTTEEFNRLVGRTALEKGQT